MWPQCVRLVLSLSATCPPCVHLMLLALAAPPLLVRPLSARYPRCVWLVLLALAAPPVLVCHLSALCPPCVLGFCPPCVRLVSALCLPCVRLLSAVAAPPPCVRLVSASCPLWPCLQTLSAMYSLVSILAAPPNLVRHVSLCVSFGRASKPWPAVCLVSTSPCICLVSALAAFRSVASPTLPSVSAICPLLVFSLSSRCPLVFHSLSALCRFLAWSMVWLWPGLCQLCVRSLIFAPLFVLCQLLSTLIEVFVAGPLPAVHLVTFSRQYSCLP